MAKKATAIAPDKELVNEVVVGSRFGYTDAVALRIDTADRDIVRLDQQAIRRMRLDAEIESDVSILADSIFADGMEIVSCISKDDDPEFELAAEIADFCKKATITSRPVTSVLKEMFKGAFYNGVKVGELVLRYQNDSQIDGKLVLDRINPKPNHSTAFVTDKYYNVLGLVGARGANGLSAPAGPISLTSEEIIPRDKFLVLAFELEDNDPRGLQMIRAAYEDYCEKKLTREQWKEWRHTAAIPKKFGTTAQGAKRIVVENPDGSPVVNNGVQQTVSPQKALMTAMEGFANNAAIAAEYGTAIAQLEVTGTGVQFERHYKVCDSAIRKVILGDALVTGAADKDARAARESSKDVSDIKKQAYRIVIADAIERDILRLLTIVNYGLDKAHLTPQCFLGDTEVNDWATDLSAAASAGYKFDGSHFAELDTQFGLTPRDNAPDDVTTPNDQKTTDQQAADDQKTGAKSE